MESKSMANDQVTALHGDDVVVAAGASRSASRSRENVDINSHFDGGAKFSWSRWISYTRPTTMSAYGRPGPLDPEAQLFHRDVLQRQTYRPNDLERYLHTGDGKPRRLFVQATTQAHGSAQGPWRRTKLKGAAPRLLLLSSWVTKSAHRTIDGSTAPPNGAEVMLSIGRAVLASPLFALMLLVPLSSPPNPTPWYSGVPTKCWEYPKHARNPLDARPGAPARQEKVNDEPGAVAIYDTVGTQARLLAPRILVVLRADGRWVDEEQGRYGLGRQYLFVSYTSAHFPDEVEKHKLELAARAVCAERGLPAYWIDFRCRAQQQPELTDDIHRICDVVRGSSAVFVFLPDAHPFRIAEWGSRVWTLSEALLAPKHEIYLRYMHDGSVAVRSLLEMPGTVWQPARQGANAVEEAEDFRQLAEHFTGTITLSRLELFSVGLRALRSRVHTEFQKGDVAYALMALLQHRPRMDPTDSEAQALARLSLANDSDRIVERMACLFSNRYGDADIFSVEDDMGAKLWDVEPTCQVAGVCKDGGIILDGCRGISIRWKNIPRIGYTGRSSWKRRFGVMACRGAVPIIFIAALVSIIDKGAGIFFVVLGLVLLLASPWIVEMVYGGKVWDQTPWLIGFEGVLGIREIERVTFGNAIGRLQFAPSSSAFAQGRPAERIGAEPRVGGDVPVPPGHRLFTLIDTGSMTVTVFAARKPPSVALISGKEGGMLRTLLCSYDRGRNAFIRQSVIRMETPTESKTGLLGWIKLVNV